MTPNGVKRSSGAPYYTLCGADSHLSLCLLVFGAGYRCLRDDLDDEFEGVESARWKEAGFQEVCAPDVVLTVFIQNFVFFVSWDSLVFFFFFLFDWILGPWLCIKTMR